MPDIWLPAWLRLSKKTNTLVLMTRTCAFFAIFLSLQSCNALALESIEKEGLYFYFYKEDTDLVARFTEPLPSMLAFLSAKGLPVKAPVHVVLDELR